MKTNKYIVLALGAALVFASSCTKELNLANSVDESKYLSAVKPIAAIRDDAGKAYSKVVEMYNNEATVTLTSILTRKYEKRADVTLEFGTQADLDAYNAEHGTSFKMIPDGYAVLESNDITFLKDETTSADHATVKITMNDAVFTEDFATYGIPVIVKTNGEDVKAGSSFMILAKDYRHIPDNRKYAVGGNNQQITIFNCTETGSNNILNNLSFTLKNSGKYLIDVAMLFTNDIKWNESTLEVDITLKPGPEGHAGRQESIIGEMHRHGCKVILCLTNYGVNQLSGQSAKDYARKVAQYVYLYNLDGVFIDSEYTLLPTERGFDSPTAANGARLCYEMKMAMPDKMVVTYLYSYLRTTTDIDSVDGKAMKDIVDFALNDYGGTVEPKALPRTQVAIRSDNFASSYKNVSTNNMLTCKKIMNDGYGAHFFYVLTPGRYEETNEMAQYVRPSLANIASAWFGDEIVVNDLNAKTEW